MRAGTELGITTVGIYTYEDRYSLHRYKCDEAYQIGREDEPLRPYLDIENLITLAKAHKIDAIHPGYGFLSENLTLAKRCKEEGILFVGPEPDAMEALGDKVRAKNLAAKAGIPMIPDYRAPLANPEEALERANIIGYPIMIKAAAGGGGRGMRVIRDAANFISQYREATNEAANAFGDGTLFLEKFVEDPKHIEVQLLGDKHGNLVHLYERDCSVQRRFQKVVEVAPSFGLKEETRHKLFDYAIRIGREVKYSNAGTVEFLVDKEENIFFIEVNPRIQVEHTVTEEITGIDLVRSQLLIAMGYKLSDNGIYISSQLDVPLRGFAIQCRITTEDPSNGFKPDFGTIIAYRNAAGFGVRLDEGSAYAGAKISPYFDSMIVKLTARGRTLSGACQRLSRALLEFRIRGVRTNIPFLQNVINHPIFRQGESRVGFLDSHPELLRFRRANDRSTKTLHFLGEVIVNGNQEFGRVVKKSFVHPKPVLPSDLSEVIVNRKQSLTDLGPQAFCQKIKQEKQILYTDTSFRDAHQSLLATRMRTKDMLKVADQFAQSFPQLFSMEVWGGATFDVAMRFLYECPWKRLQLFRAAMPNQLLQMLFRGSNGVGYTAYPDNLIEKFIERSWEMGIDVFRIFDSLNWVEAMLVSMKAVRERTNAICEAAICYTGEMTHKDQKKYTLQYYLDMARKLEDAGAHIIAIKDMAGLLKPYTAEILIKELKKAIDLPIHLHTHDTSGIQSATYLKAIEAGVDVVDVAIASMSGLTSQPNFNSIVAMMQGQERASNINVKRLNEFSNYWEDVREYYYPFESGLKASTAEIFDHEIPGGQYSNLRPQAVALGLIDRFDELKQNYVEVNQLFGDIIKVTPSSKVVGDMALFLMSNHLKAEDVYTKGTHLSFPESVKSLMRGDLGQSYGGFDPLLQDIILKGEHPITVRPNTLMPLIDLEQDYNAFILKFEHHNGWSDYLSYKMYPKVFEDYYNHREHYGDVSIIPTHAFFYGLKMGEEIMIDIDKGKNILVQLTGISEADDDGICTVSFKLNGQTRQIKVKDKGKKVTKKSNEKVSQPGEIGSPLQGRISKLGVKAGDIVSINTPLFVIEAMKMETTVVATQGGKIEAVYLKEGSIVEQDDRVVRIGE